MAKALIFFKRAEMTTTRRRRSHNVRSARTDAGTCSRPRNEILGLEITRERLSKAFSLLGPSSTNVLQSVDSTRGGWFRIAESYPGAWQQNVVIDRDTVLAQSTAFACITLIASDAAKLRHKLVQQDSNGIWEETTSPAFSPFLRKPNHYQNHIQFKEWWFLSKLIHGNTYALKQRDSRGVVIAEYLLDPTKVTPLVSEEGAIFYRLKVDNLSGLSEEITVPAREIIHDRMNCLFHPLVGVSPLFASGLAALQALRIQNNSTVFFANNTNPGGVLTAPGPITDEAAVDIGARWAANYSGLNSGKLRCLATA